MSPIKVQIVVSPYVSSTGQILTDKQRVIVINDLEAETKTNNDVANAIGAIYQAVQSLIIEKNINFN